MAPEQEQPCNQPPQGSGDHEEPPDVNTPQPIQELPFPIATTSGTASVTASTSSGFKLARQRRASFSSIISSSRKLAALGSRTLQGNQCNRATDTRILSVAVPPDLLRAVPLECAFSGFGRHWSGDVTGGLGTESQVSHYELSTKVESIEDFISHDWASGRWGKLFTLACVYNFKAAFVWSVLVALVVSMVEGGILLSGQPLVHSTIISVGDVGYFVYNGTTALILPPLVFAFILLLGQRLPVRFLGQSKSTMVFFDKLCIHQTDQELKAQGICHIAGFLQRSDRIVVLWSPQYLTRLWCVYEVACWVHLQKDFRTQAIFAPIALSCGVLGAMVGTYLFFCVCVISADKMSLWSFIQMVPIIVCICLPVPLRLLRRTVKDLGSMREQLQNFRLQSSECYCCSIRHESPDGGPVPCDRELIYSTLSSWFRQNAKKDPEATSWQPNSPESTTATEEVLVGESGEEYLNRFNDFVYDDVMPAICDQVLNAKMRYWLCLRISTPLIWYTFTRWLVFLQMSGFDSLRYALESVTFALLIYPGMLMALLRLTSLSNRLGGSRGLAGGVFDLAMTLLLLASGLAVVAFVWGPLIYTRTVNNFVYQAGVTAAEIIFCALVFLMPWKP